MTIPKRTNDPFSSRRFRMNFSASGGIPSGRVFFRRRSCASGFAIPFPVRRTAARPARPLFLSPALVLSHSPHADRSKQSVPSPYETVRDTSLFDHCVSVRLSFFLPANITIEPELKAQVDKQREEVRTKYEGTDKWLKVPNGKSSNLPEDLRIIVRTPYFKAWFGDWENVERRDVGPVAEGSAPVTSALTPTSMTSHPYSQYTPGSGKVKLVFFQPQHNRERPVFFAFFGIPA